MLVGASSRDIRATARLTMIEPPAGECSAGEHPPAAKPALSKANRLRELIADDQALNEAR